ncbi:MAG: hypothetical protein ACI8XI_000875 [Woeseiaceae bacterium]|jgi:hypothetical protein|tara:strand:+ start:8404 stop:8712 length:309 start_codon:yes stop_codon:yes gene_type:complete
MTKQYSNFKDFYPYYIQQHKNKYTKLLHFIGAWFFISFISILIYSHEIKYLLFAFLSAYGFAWIGHFFIEENKPATFDYPIYSFMGDCLMFIEILKGKHKIL